MPPTRSWSVVVVLLAALSTVHGHSHHDKIDEADLHAPIDTVLYLHFTVQALVWGVLFPTGMVLGLIRSRWHVPVQSVSLALTLAGYVLGHKHGGRQFPYSLHGIASNFILVPLISQAVLGVYLKLHIHEKTIRPWAVLAHGIIGKLFPVFGWCQMLFGAIVLGGYCLEGALGQCLAHYIMGSAFVGYGIILAILLLVGQDWIRRSGRSPEWWDSWVIFLWGIVNTFTEHHGGAWTHKDLQHTTMGVLWWAGGALAILLSRKNKRTVIPSLIIIITGWAMSSHTQAFVFSGKIHSVFGWTLMGAGVARLTDICFIAPALSNTAGQPTEGNTVTTISPFQHLPPFLLVAGGLLFMSATDEELHYVEDSGLDHVTYVLMMFSLAFIIYALTTFLLSLVIASNETPSNGQPATSSPRPRKHYYRSVPDTASMFSGYTMGPTSLNEHEIFELDGGPGVDEEDPFDDSRAHLDRRTS